MDDADGPHGRWLLPVAVVAVGLAAAAPLALFVLGTGSSCACQPPTDASVEAAPNGSAVTVTYTTRGSEDALAVTVDGAVPLAALEGDATRTDDGARLASVGAGATFAETDPDTETAVDVTVVAVGDGTRTVVVERRLTL